MDFDGTPRPPAGTPSSHIVSGLFYHKTSIMEGHLPPTRDEFYHVQMDVKHVQAVQTNHADRILRLEKRQADDAALKSVWNSPFPSVLGGTPQQGQLRLEIIF